MKSFEVVFYGILLTIIAVWLSGCGNYQFYVGMKDFGDTSQYDEAHQAKGRSRYDSRK